MNTILLIWFSSFLHLRAGTISYISLTAYQNIESFGQLSPHMYNELGIQRNIINAPTLFFSAEQKNWNEHGEEP